MLRNLTAAEAECLTLLPPELREVGWPKPDPAWIWVVENHRGPIALVMGSYVSGVCVFWRILTTASAKANINWALAAFPSLLENIRDRGCVGYAAFFHDSKPEEAHLARLMVKAGGVVEPFNGSLSVVPLLPDGVNSSCLTLELQKSLLSSVL
jgi:hypothetical protein